MGIFSNKKYIIFDFDRTIATVNVNWANWHMGAGNIYQKYEPNFKLHLLGKKIYHLQNEMFKKYGQNFKTEIDLFTRKFEATEVNGIEPISKTIKLINDMYEVDNKLYIWSSNDTDLVNKSLKELNLYDKFEFIVTRDMVAYLKPETSGFDKYLRNFDSDLGKFLMVGDSGSDRDAAKNCKIDYLDVLDII
jgi:FMN phosphatase YigB (HAD superfamily)